MNKTENNPKQQELIRVKLENLRKVPRCGAKTRRSRACLSPAVRGKKRCRMHGGAKGSGAPKGNQNALRDGFHTRSAIAQRHGVRIMMKECQDFVKGCDPLEDL